MVGVERFELPTSCSQSRRATRLRYTPNNTHDDYHQASHFILLSRVKNGRGREIRTPDILLPKQARYQTALYPEQYAR